MPTAPKVPAWLIHAHEGAVSFDVVVVPRASRSQIQGLHAGALKIALAAPPVDGEANAELCATLAKALGIPKRAIRITRGEHHKSKTVRAEGVDEASVRALAGVGSDGAAR